MARIRNLKPEFWDSPDTAEADLAVRLTYMAMWNWADDSGRGTANLKELEAFAWPNDDVRELPRSSSRTSATQWPNFGAILAEVQRCYGVVFYKVDRRPFYWIPSFQANQSKHFKPDSRLPSVEEGEKWCLISEYGDTLEGGAESRLHSSRTSGTPPPNSAGKSPLDRDRDGDRDGEVLAHLGTETTDAHAMLEPAGETPPGPKVPIQGWKLVREHTPANLGQSSRSMLAIRVDEMIRSGTPESDVRACLDLWMTKPEAGPGLLPHLLAEVVKTRDHKPSVEGAATRGANEWIGIANKYGSADTTTELMKELER